MPRSRVGTIRSSRRGHTRGEQRTIGSLSSFRATETGGSGDVQATVVDTVASSSQWGSLPAGGVLSASSPDEALRLDEIGRFHALTRVMRWLSLGLIVLLPLFEYGSVLRWVLVGGLALGIPLGLWFDRVIAVPGGLTSRRMTAAAVGLGINVFVGVAHFGVFSGAVSLVVLGLFVVSRTEFRGAAIFVTVTCMALQAILASLVIADVVEDPGLIQVIDPSWRDQVLMQGSIIGVFVLAYLLGRASRQTTLEAIDKLELARKQVEQREALLHEARQDLDLALAAGGPGRYTEALVGGYRLGGVIGRGAMAEVYEGFHADSGEPAAVKLLHDSVRTESRAIERFFREAQAAASIRSPHVPRVLAASDHDAALPYLAMERLRGKDLAQLLRDRTTLPLSEVVDLVGQVGRVIDAAREAGVVHRDLKPQNLFLDERDGQRTWKVLDFGVSALTASSGTLTQGFVVGTPAYIAPEQARGRDVDHRADIHSLAAIAYRCLTGRPPFLGPDIPALLYAAVHSMPDAPSTLADLPPDVDAVVAIGMAKPREARYGSGAAFAAALAQAARGDLPPAERIRAAALLADHPWATTRGD